MQYITLLSLLFVARCTCMNEETCMGTPYETLSDPVLARALLQVRKTETQFTFQTEQTGSKDWSFITKLVTKRDSGETNGIGSEASLDEKGYESVKSSCCNLEMMFFIRRVIDEVLNFEICNEGGLSGFVPWFTCETNSVKTYYEMLDELKRSIPPLNCAFLAQKGQCAGLDFAQCYGVPNPDQYADCGPDETSARTTTRTTTRSPPTDCTPYNKGEICVGNGPHGNMGAITTLCQCDCLQCEKLKGRRCLLQDCIDLQLVDSTRCSPTWPGQPGTCIADQNDHTCGFCIIPVPAGCPPVSLYTTVTTTTATLDCTPLNVGEVCVGSGSAYSSTTTVCTCDCQLCEAKLKMLGQNRPCVSSDCLNLHLTDAHDCNPVWPGRPGVCTADLEGNTGSLCKIPLPPGCLVPTPQPGTTITTSPPSCDPLSKGEVCIRAGATSTTTCECDCEACSVKKGDYCTADDCISLGFFDVSKCAPAWPGVDSGCIADVTSHCKIPVPTGCPPVVLPTPLPTQAPVTTTTTTTTTTKASISTTKVSSTTKAPATTTVKTTTTTPRPTTPTTTTTSLDCSPINNDVGSVCADFSGDGTALCKCDCVKCRHFLPFYGRYGTEATHHCSVAECQEFAPDTRFDSVACLNSTALGTCQTDASVLNPQQRIKASSYCKVDVPDGCPQPAPEVNCGGHSAVSCPECGREAGLCNGDCQWVEPNVCYPKGPFVERFFDCGAGTRAKDCSLCSEEECRQGPSTSESTCRMAWSRYEDDSPVAPVEHCVSNAYECEGLAGRFSHSDCSSCGVGNDYGHYEVREDGLNIWRIKPNPDTNVCEKKKPNPPEETTTTTTTALDCTPLDPTDKGSVCFRFGSPTADATGNCACDCDMCRKFTHETCDFHTCQTYSLSTGLDLLGCMNSASANSCSFEPEASSGSGYCKIAVPEGCPQPKYEPVDCGNGKTANSCPLCGEGADCGGECAWVLPDQCFPKGAYSNGNFDCGDGTGTKNCAHCSLDVCKPNPSSQYTMSCHITQDDDGNDECTST